MPDDTAGSPKSSPDFRLGSLVLITAFIAVASGLFGLVIGSFLNVVIVRVPEDQSVVKPRSRCPNCESEISPRDNVPVLSWLLLRGKCRNCGWPIPARYPIIEALTGVAFTILGVVLGEDAALPAMLVFTAALIAVSAIDLERRIIPKKIVWPALAIVGLLLLGAAVATGDFGNLATAAIGGAGAFGFLYVVWFIAPKGMGFGDVRLCALIGTAVGWYGIGHVLVALFLSFVFGSVVGIGLMVFAGRSRKSALPFGPSLAAGAYVALLVGEPILDLYLG